MRSRICHGLSLTVDWVLSLLGLLKMKRVLITGPSAEVSPTFFPLHPPLSFTTTRPVDLPHPESSRIDYLSNPTPSQPSLACPTSTSTIELKRDTLASEDMSVSPTYICYAPTTLNLCSPNAQKTISLGFSDRFSAGKAQSLVHIIACSTTLPVPRLFCKRAFAEICWVRGNTNMYQTVPWLRHDQSAKDYLQKAIRH